MIEEKAKYDGIYSDPQRYPRYGHTNHGSRALGLLAKAPPESVLDLGCGWNEFAKQVRTAFPDIRVVGADFSCPGADVKCEATQLPFADKEFDLITSFDMLEHLPEVEVDRSLQEMSRVAHRFTVAISYQDSVTRWRGETLHPTVRPEEWWMLKLVKAGAIALSKHGRYISGKWKAPLRIDPKASVVLVGNGPSVMDAPIGRLIDTFDEVIRFNNFQITGFEDYVGTKTTLWSTFFKAVDANDKHSRVFCPHENTVPPDHIQESYHMASWFFDKARKEAQQRSYWRSGFTKDTKGLLASSGMSMLQYLLEVLEVKKVHVCGFDHFSKHRSSQHHYWLPSAFKRPAEHDGDAEAAMFEQLRLAGRVAYL